MIHKFCVVCLSMIFGTSFIFVLILCILTPEKTNAGTYTQPIKYWTSIQYVCDNFDNTICKGR